MSFIKKLSVFSVLSLFALSVLAIPFAVAQDGQNQQSGSGLQLSPTRTELSIIPGDQRSFTIKLTNVTQNDVTAKAFLNDFESDNVSGTPKIIVDENREPTPYSLKDILKGLTDVELKAGEAKDIELTADVAQGTPPGAYFGAIRYAAVPAGGQQGETDRQVSLTASVAHLVFLEVPGDINQQIQVQGIELKNGSDTTSFYQSPNRAEIAVKNLGNGFARPFGKVTLMRGGSEVYTYDINNTDPKGIILPQSSRTFSDEVKNVSTPGKYKIVASVAYGNGGEVVSFEKSFWYLPLWFLGVIALVIILLIVAGVVVYKKYVAKKFGK